MKKLLVLSTMLAMLSGLAAQAVTIQENAVFPNQDIITGQSQLAQDGTQIMRNEDSLHIGTGQSFTLSSAETLAAITIQMGVGRNKTMAAGTHEFELWIGSYDDTTVSNHVVGVTKLLTSIDVAGLKFSSGNYYTLNLDTPLSLPAGDYAFQLYWTTADQGDHRIWWARNSTGGYADGALLAQGELPATGGLPFEEVKPAVDSDLVFALHSAPITGVLASLTTPEELAMSHVIGAGSTTGTVDAVMVSETTMDVSITISDQSDVGAFTILSATPQTLTNETTELSFEFDNSVANLAGGETATGLVSFAWVETGGGASGTNYMPISALVDYPADQVNTFRGYASSAWGTATNWNLGRVPGTLAADKAIIQGSDVVDVTTNFTGAYVWNTVVRGDGATLNINANFKNSGDMTLSGASGHYGYVNQVSGGVDIAALKIGHASGVSASNSVYTISGGKLTSTADGSILTNGQMIVNVGALVYDTDGNNDMTIAGDGLLTVESGKWNSTADAAGDVLTFNPDVEISGGTIDLNGRNHFSGEFKIIGDAASISIQRLNIAPDFIFEFAPGGGAALSLVDCPTYLNLTNGTILVDGSNYTGGNAEIQLFSSDAVNKLPADPATAFVTTNFAVGITAVITADTNSVILSITGAGPSEDPIISSSVEDGSMILSWADGIAYDVLTNANLQFPNWGVLVSGAASPVTNSIGDEAKLFYKLEYP